MPAKARSKTTIGTATAVARVVVETPLVDLLLLLVSVAVDALEETPVEVLEAALLVVVAVVVSSLVIWPSGVLVSATSSVHTFLHATDGNFKIRTSPTRWTNSRITLRTLRRAIQPSIIRVDESEVARIDSILPNLQGNGVIAARRRAMAVTEDERAVESVTAPGVGAVVWRAA